MAGRMCMQFYLKLAENFKTMENNNFRAKIKMFQADWARKKDKE